MRKLLCAVVLFLLGSLAAVAQDFPKAEVLPHIAVRVAQFDWMSFRSNGDTSNNNFRYSAGVVFHP